MVAFALISLLQAVAPDPAPEEDVIEVVGTRSDQVQKIDRRTYRVQETPHAIQKDTYQLLRGLPAVTVSADDTISLLGSPNVTVLVDGLAYQGDLRTLHGSDIERIEIITNPSAQYAAQGTGGIINLVRRKVRKDGVTGTLSGEASSLGSFRGNGSWKRKRGSTTLELTPHVGFGTWQRSNYSKDRTIFPPSGPPRDSHEEGGGRVYGANYGATLKLTYDVSSSTSVTGSVYGGAGRYANRSHSTFTPLGTTVGAYAQDFDDHGGGNFFWVELSASHKGKTEGETLTGSSSLFGNPTSRNITDVELDDGRSFTSRRRDGTLYWQTKLDWQHPIGDKQILSTGADVLLQRSNPRYRFEGVTPSAPVAIVEDDYRGRQLTAAAYVTFQHKFGRLAVMPGLRLESSARTVTSPGQPDVHVRNTQLFPTLHVERALGKRFNLTLSYSRRIERPRLDDLRPYAVQHDPQYVTLGNPDLRDETTAAYELNLHYRRDKTDIGLILYDRETDDLVRTLYSIDAEGRNVSKPFNVGRKRDRGAQFDVTTPLFTRTKAIASLNLFEAREPVDDLARRYATRFRYSTNLTLDYVGKEKGGRPADAAQFIWHYESPSTQYQFRYGDWHTLSLSYTHSFDKKLSMTASADSGALGGGHRLDAPDVIEDFSIHRRPTVTIKLLRTLGKR